MEIPKALLDRLKRNEEIARKFNEIEISILSILDFHNFFDRLLAEISDKFFIPHIWVAIISEGRLARHLEDNHDSRELPASMVNVPQQTFSSIVSTPKPLLANTGLSAYNQIIPHPMDQDIGSIAIAPISLDGEIVGSINQADPDPKRFEPGIDTSLLEQLALKVSLCLSNVTAHEQLKFLAFHDPLTGLLNRGVMKRVLEREFSRAKRYGTDLSLIFLDLDDFKTINDTAGHDIGDQILCLVARALTYQKRDSDIVARFAGDEFIVILPSSNTSHAEKYIHRVQHYLETTPLNDGKKDHFIRLSHGISNILDADIKETSDMVKIADKRMYQVKSIKKGLTRPKSLSI
ncbi:sensor domain-containing diguanylate cyclase [uncultured Desulfobacter sp.]|uniref:sensor domain-containing diguanylate cyclase n=1 Tax=uncultured Desulfobacter sp. TaxID=240139 RepID=UPI0029F52FE4|nr:sensor domain-containing diguanylate cyclase [uncultured Desulfobacter sp.]